MSMKDVIEKRSEEVFCATDPVVPVTRADIGFLKGEAAGTSRERTRLCAHEDVGDAVHEMLIVHGREAYVRPHKHHGKSESFHVIEGTGVVLLYGDDGTVEQAVPIGEYGSGRPFYIRISDARFHSLVITSDTIVFHETTKGPFVREETEFAPWSPDEDNPEAVTAFLETIAAAVTEAEAAYV